MAKKKDEWLFSYLLFILAVVSLVFLKVVLQFFHLGLGVKAGY